MSDASNVDYDVKEYNNKDFEFGLLSRDYIFNNLYLTRLTTDSRSELLFLHLYNEFFSMHLKLMAKLKHISGDAMDSVNDSTAQHNANEISNLTTDDANTEAASENNVNLEIEPNIKIYSSIEEFDKNLPSTVTLITNEFGSKVYIVGTAHFSKESQDDVSLVIRNVRPDVVMVELCAARVHMLNHDEKTLLEEAKDMSFAKIQSITKTNGLMNGLFYILMLNMSAKLTTDLGMAPGGEFRRAVEEMKLLSNPVLHLGDRSINITLKRAFNGLSLWQTLKIVSKLLFTNKSITKEEVEQCKQKDLLEELLDQMADEYPVFRDVFVTERDLYLAHSLSVAALPQFATADGRPKPVTVVGVVGIGHTKGIVNNWGKVKEEQLTNILQIPPASLSTRAFKFTVKTSILLLCGYGVFKLCKPRVMTISNLFVK